MKFDGLRLLLLFCTAVLAVSIAARADTDSNQPFQLEQLLPSSIQQSTDINAWGWFSYLHDDAEDDSDYGVADVALGATQRLGDRIAVTADMHFIDDNGFERGFLEQAFVTTAVIPSTETLLTIGKFNASFGIEPRDEWDRFGGTTSLLFGAQPQDLVGVMLTQPLGDTGIKLLPFITTNFQGSLNFDHSPSGGLLLEYRPSESLHISLTNWVGAGFESADDDDDDAGDESYTYSTNDYVTDNWNGPDVYGDVTGLLYLADLSVRWNPRPDLTLAGEGLIATTGHHSQELAWNGLAGLVNYDITDRLRVFGRWSYLNDVEGFLTQTGQTVNEISGGVGVEVISGLELRGEYRHNFASTGDLDIVSVHLTYSY